MKKKKGVVPSFPSVMEIKRGEARGRGGGWGGGGGVRRRVTCDGDEIIDLLGVINVGVGGGGG